MIFILMLEVWLLVIRLVHNILPVKCAYLQHLLLHQKQTHIALLNMLEVLTLTMTETS